MPEQAIACTLTPDELAKRKNSLLDEVVRQATKVEPRNEGYAFCFRADDAILARLFEVIQKERKCCRFLQFELKVTPDEGPVWLSLSGPEGTKAFLDSLDLRGK